MNLTGVFIIRWSDIAGRKRKTILLLPVFGLILEMVLGCLHSYFWQWSSLAAVVTYALCQILTGGQMVFFNVLILYVSDTTSKEDRTSQIAKLLLLSYVSVPIGNVLVGSVLKKLGFFNTFLLGLLFSVVSFILGIVFIDDISVPVEEKESLFEIVNPLRIKEVVGVLYRRRPHKKRLILILLLLSKILLTFSKTGK